jgi:hypothetical protein
MNLSTIQAKLRNLTGARPDGISVTGVGMRADWFVILVIGTLLTLGLWGYAAYLYIGVAGQEFVVEPSAEDMGDDVLDAAKIERLEALIRDKQAARAELRAAAPAPLTPLGGRIDRVDLDVDRSDAPAIVP